MTDHQLCACTSGLSAAHCCSFDPAAADAPVAAETGESAGDRLVAKAQQAAEALRAGDRVTAERLSLEVLEAGPRRPVALATLAEICMDAGRPKAAAALLQRLIEIDPTNFWPVNKLGMLELNRGNAGEAEKHARHSVRIAPDNPQAHNLMGMTMTGDRTRTARRIPLPQDARTLGRAHPDGTRQPRDEPRRPESHPGGARALPGS